MEEFWILILVLFFATNSLDKAESAQFEKTPLKIIDEIFGEGWWDNDKAEEWDKLTLEQNFHHQIDRHNTQIGQIEPNSTDQNPPITESDHSDKAKDREELNAITSSKNIADDERKRKIIAKFDAIKDKFKQMGKHSKKEWVQIDNRITKHLKVNRAKIFKWKKEFGLSRKVAYENEERKHLIEKFDQRKAELTRAGFKSSYKNEINEIVSKELGITDRTIYNWKRELSHHTTTKHEYANIKQKELLMKLYYEIKDKNSNIRDVEIAKMMKIGIATLYKWKRQFRRQQMHPNSVDGHFVEENFGPTIQEIGNSDLNE